MAKKTAKQQTLSSFLLNDKNCFIYDCYFWLHATNEEQARAYEFESTWDMTDFANEKVEKLAQELAKELSITEEKALDKIHLFGGVMYNRLYDLSTGEITTDNQRYIKAIEAIRADYNF